ncbi:starch phosphorylase [Thiogranum longum]|uniref:Starch phosphorylase n=1 Tax=Thiogranum longum TaxID=1537524 RepID=A0A4R1HEM4_9GAMM|nr:alpha-glucan family phosphorylase [Thiogranum longum]TCK18640.1 starch phosphorylase [Thiogranum longum]
MPGTHFKVEIRPQLPERLERLQELANDLYYSWNRGVRRLFRHLDEQTWINSNSNPKVFLRRVGQKKLEQAARDPIFLGDFRSILSEYDTYIQERPLTEVESSLDMDNDLVAYFSAEFGFHQSVPIYAGGLGILAGDYCKAMSNLGVPFIGVGLLYHEGYFTQRILRDGKQLADYPHVNPEDLPVTEARDAQGRELDVNVIIAGRPVKIKVWEVRAGHIKLYLLDSDIPENTPQERVITGQLYGGDSEARIKQEIVLGIGGVRALRAMGLAPTVWHINEGHAGFQVLERCREYVAAGMKFDAALELAAANTVFTTHTPVPAGHDIFSTDLVRTHLSALINDLGCGEQRFLALGENSDHTSGFNMTTLGLHGSRFCNGVSRIHGHVAAEMESHLWPQIPPDENPIGYVTNGVDVDTFLGQSWAALFDMYVGRGWRAKLTDKQFWGKFINEIPDHVYLSVRHIHKNAMLKELRCRMIAQLTRNGCVESEIRTSIRHLTPPYDDILVIGFARRFATYKRATLLFRDIERLERLVNDTDRPVLFIFAGKAHPKDVPGKQLIREITAIANLPAFRGKILLLEDYNLSLARDLYPGVDVWLNVPEYPKEACGTSGMKAAINGAINLSILDGWWAEAFDGDNGWAITPHPELDAETRDAMEADELLNILEHEVLPLYFSRDENGEALPWIEKSKASLLTILPHFNNIRMASDYLRDYYGPAASQGKRLASDNAAGAVELACWEKVVAEAWPEITARLTNAPADSIVTGHPLPVEVTVGLNDLQPRDVEVECVIGQRDGLDEFIPVASVLLKPDAQSTQGETIYRADLCNPRPCDTFDGLQYYQIRLYPTHPLLSHRFACGLMLWL